MPVPETFDVDWITELPREPAENECIVLSAIKRNGDPIIVRYIDVAHYDKMRAANKISPAITDRAFLADGLDELITRSNGAVIRFQIGFAEKMPPSEEGETVTFSKDPFEQQ